MIAWDEFRWSHANTGPVAKTGPVGGAARYAHGSRTEYLADPSATAPSLVPTVGNVPLRRPVFDVRLVERANGTENGQDVVLVALAPSDQLVDDDVLGGDYSAGRPIKSHLLIFDLDEQEVGPDSIAPQQEKVSGITWIGDRPNVESDGAKGVVKSIHGFNKKVQVGCESRLVSVLERRQRAYQSPAGTEAVKNGGDGC